jgi:hypothetical protein
MVATISAPRPRVDGGAAQGDPHLTIITGEKLAHDLTRHTSEPLAITGPVWVIGPCSLRHRSVRRPVELSGCIFEGPVDLRYAEFHQTVNLSGCEFHGAFNSGDATESCTIFHKDLNCSHAHFFGQASFNGARVEGSTYFHHAGFHRPVHPPEPATVDFTTFICRGSLEFNHATFESSVSFNAMRCGAGLFKNVHFEDADHQVNFRNAHFEGNLQIWSEQALRKTGAEGENGGALAVLLAERERPVFRGGADFAGVCCGRKTILSGCWFQGGAKVTFKCASFGWFLECNDARFDGPVSFLGTRAQDYLKLSGSHFTFCRSCDKTATGPQPNDDDDDDVDLRFIHTGGNLSLKRARVDGTINLGQAVIGGKLRLSGASFHNDVKLYDASMKILELWSKGDQDKAAATLKVEEMLPFKQPHSLDVTSCAFERFHGGPPEIEHRLALAFVDAQDPRKFSRDPYLQLEQYYRRTGQEHTADQIHLEGHKAIHKNARQPKDKCVNWSTWQIVRDWLFWKLSGWGLQPFRILYLSLFIVLVGAAVFSPLDALRPTKAYVEELVGAGYSAPVETADIVRLATLHDRAQYLLDRLFYSLDLFIPAIDFGYTARWEPPITSVYLIIASVETTLGWVLATLLLAAVVGIIKSD